ncbi:hypothetical protein KEM52_004143 [Ascosphaera acerosa]|nr:hypothetical protein KEM52_004143 [Ascosphaera acerosa]
MLPLGLRTQVKLEGLIDKHMRELGASRVELSNLSSQSLWERSGRYTKDSELFTLADRRGAKFLLAPTHEEEITSLVSSTIQSYRDLPIRLYQITRKYRDEPRPRQGLLRGREFVMKDLYTFDTTVAAARETYELVKAAYVRLFNQLRIPYLVAAADSGSIGGEFSHEFHVPSSKGEDTVVSCRSCGSTWNEELSTGQAAVRGARAGAHDHDTGHGDGEVLASEAATTVGGVGVHKAEAISTDVWTGVSNDGRTLVRVFYPKFLMRDEGGEPTLRYANTHAIKAICRSLNISLASGIKDAGAKWRATVSAAPTKAAASTSGQPETVHADRTGQAEVVDIYDHRVRPYDRPPIAGLLGSDLSDQPAGSVPPINHSLVTAHPDTRAPLDCIIALPGDTCPRCGVAAIETHTTIELGHTFHLGTRYSSVLGASVQLPQDTSSSSRAGAGGGTASGAAAVPLQMGCHGIGVSRMLAAVADALADSRGLHWPAAIAPFQVLIVADQAFAEQAAQLYDAVTAVTGGNAEAGTHVDAIIDDRSDKSMPWRLRDADLVGYPVLLVLGRAFRQEGRVEVQCRRLQGLRELVGVQEVPAFTRSLLARL